MDQKPAAYGTFRAVGAAIVTALCSAALSFALAFTPLCIFVGAYIGAAFTRRLFKYAALGVLLGVGALFAATGSALTALYLPLYLLPGLALGVFFTSARRGTLRDGAMLCCTVSFASLLLALIVLWLTLGDVATLLSGAARRMLMEESISVDALRAAMEPSILFGGGSEADIVRQLSDLRAMTRMQIADTLSASLDETLRALLPAALLCAGALSGTVNLLIVGRYVSRRAGMKIVPPFSEWMIRRKDSLAFSLMLLIALIAVFIDHPVAVIGQYIMLSLFYLVYGMQGLAAGSYYLRRWGVKTPLRAVLIALLGIFGSFLIILLGIADQAMGMRRTQLRVKAAAPPND